MESGYILSETRDIVVIATMESENRKTGDMVQTWILPRNESPVSAVRNGTDSLICGDCKHRGNPAADIKRSCYVNVGQGPNSVWRAYIRGRYQFLELSEYARVFHGRAIRLGAYGDPAMAPLGVISELCRVSVRHTGYTHQWRAADWLQPFVMASVDTIAEWRAAHAAGWRTFRVTDTWSKMPGEILCPASDEYGHKTQCIKCGLCNGSQPADVRKSIFIPVHGTGASNFTKLIQIGA